MREGRRGGEEKEGGEAGRGEEERREGEGKEGEGKGGDEGEGRGEEERKGDAFTTQCKCAERNRCLETHLVILGGVESLAL